MVFNYNTKKRVPKTIIIIHYQLPSITNYHPLPFSHHLQNLVDKDTGHTLASTNAHGSNQDLLLGSSQLTQTSNNLSSTRATKWMAKGNSTTSWVNLLMVQSKSLHTVDSHRSESLVNLENINLILADSVLGKDLWDGNRWTDTHDSWSETDSGG